MIELIRLEEPELLFAHRQCVEDPRDGLCLFGPLDEGKPYGIRAGVVGTNHGIAIFKDWVTTIQSVVGKNGSIARPIFPGFQNVFGIPWNPQPWVTIEIDPSELNSKLYLNDKFQRVYKTVDLFTDQIVNKRREREETVDIWFIVIPDEVYFYCRPRSSVSSELRIDSGDSLSREFVKKLANQYPLFKEDIIAAKPYQYEVNFHNQLKARLLPHTIPSQIIRESTLLPKEKKFTFRKTEDPRSAIAWNICTTAFYKTGGKPWKLAHIRNGVCYVGLAFKRDEKAKDPRTACCAAQMFLDSGDGVVFKGAVGPWYSEKSGEFHMSREAARQVITMALNSYRENAKRDPAELFIHGRVRFDDNEWEGFREAAGENTNLVGVRIREESDLRLFREFDFPILRGLSYIQDSTTAYLWTKGFIPRLLTYPGKEVPLPLAVEVCRGKADIEVVVQDIMALTKLNYNACVFADGPPVTLKFADAVGEILTAGPIEGEAPLPFRYYI